jgi:hypothetical protein
MGGFPGRWTGPSTALAITTLNNRLHRPTAASEMPTRRMGLPRLERCTHHCTKQLAGSGEVPTIIGLWINAYVSRQPMPPDPRPLSSLLLPPVPGCSPRSSLTRRTVQAAAPTAYGQPSKCALYNALCSICFSLERISLSLLGLLLRCRLAARAHASCRHGHHPWRFREHGAQAIGARRKEAGPGVRQTSAPRCGVSMATSRACPKNH